MKDLVGAMTLILALFLAFACVAPIFDGRSRAYAQAPSAESVACLVVRGSDNETYYQVYNSTSSTWSPWANLGGSTCDSPAAAWCSGKLYLVVRGIDGLSLWFGSLDTTDGNFSGWTLISGSTESAPALTCNETHLFLVVRGLDNSISYRIYDVGADVWGNWVLVGGATCDRPAATVLEGNLHIVALGFGTTDIVENETLWHCYVNLTDNSFSGWTSPPGTTSSAPVLTASANFSTVYMGVRGLDDSIYINNWFNSTWHDWEALPTITAAEGPALAVVDEMLQIVARSNDSISLWHCYMNLNTSALSEWVPISGLTPSAPTLSSARFSYQVIPEFPATCVILLFILATVLAVTTYRKRITQAQACA